MNIPPCFECGSPAAHRHPVVPRSQGGRRTVPLCAACRGKVYRPGAHARLPALIAAGMASKAAAGEHTGGAPPFGSRLAEDGVHLEPAEGEQEIIRQARELRRSGLSLRRVAAELDARGHRSRSGRPFAPVQVARMVDGDTGTSATAA